MNGIVDLLALPTGSAVPFGSMLIARGAALLCLALGITVMLRRAPAAHRHHVWMLAMVGLIALPAITFVAPSWRVSVPGVDAAADFLSRYGVESGQIQSAFPVPAEKAGSLVGGTTETTGTNPGASAAKAESGASAGVDFGVSPGAESGVSAGTFSGSALPWPLLFVAAWVLGFLALSLRLAAGVVRAARLVRHAEPVTDRRWSVLVSSLSLKSGLDTNVRVVSSPEVGVPMAWGIFGAWLVLPEGIDMWPEDRRRVVVLHELAHLRRRDCASQALARLALAIHWPNPLAWLAVRRMRSEREQACDDAVLAAGVGGPAYAHHLVDIARGISSGFRPARAAVAMARSSELENRVLAILDPRRSRRSLGRRAVQLSFACLALLLVPVATLHPAGAPTSPGEAADDSPPVALESGHQVEVAPEAFPPESSASLDMIDLTEPLESATLLDSAATFSKAVVKPSAVSDVDSNLASLGLVEGVADTIEERVFEALIRALGSEDPKVRRKVAHTFGMIESPRAVEPLAAVVRSDPDAAVREQAAWALGMIESDAAVDALASAASDGDVSVREQVAWALGMIESARGVAPLLPLLEDEAEQVREQAAWGLGMIESSEAVDGLMRAFATEAEASVRSKIIWALGMIEDRSALDTVVDALEDTDADVRDQALWALGMIMG